MADAERLIIVSNRGPAEFDRDAEGERRISRGGGGLVTALTGLATHRPVLWVASAMTEEDAVVAEEAGGPVEIELEDSSYEVDLVTSDPEAYDAFYSVIANPQLWFTQHYLWDLSNAPDIRAEEKWAWEYGYRVVNEDIAREVLAPGRGPRAPAGDVPRLPPLHGAGNRAGGGARRLPAPLRPHPLAAPRRLADPARAPGARTSSTACSPTTSSASTPAPTSTTSSTAAAS